jgi:hypothetical protein
VVGTGAPTGVIGNDIDQTTTEDADTMHRDEAIRLIGLARARARRRGIRTALDLAERIGVSAEVIDTLETDAAYWALLERRLSVPADNRGSLDRAA